MKNSYVLNISSFGNVKLIQINFYPDLLSHFMLEMNIVILYSMLCFVLCKDFTD